MTSRCLALLLVGAIAGCSKPSKPHEPPVVTALESCDTDTSSKNAPLAKPFRWSGSVHSFASFTMFLPDSVRVGSVDSAGTVHLVWPRCSGCRFDVAVRGDSGIDVETRIQRLLAEQRRIDSVNKHTAEVQEFDVMNGPPAPVEIPGGRGYLISESCGDCGASTLLFGRPGTVAEIGFGGDDDVPQLWRRECEMAVVAKSFGWRP